MRGRLRLRGAALTVPTLFLLSVSAYAAEEVDAAASSGGGLLSSEGFLSELYYKLYSATLGRGFAEILNACAQLFDGLMLDLVDVVFHAETIVNASDAAPLSGGMLEDLYAFIYAAACALVVLKFLFRGFQIYILWRGGDADVAPRDMLVGMLQAAFVMAAFPLLYDAGADVFTWFAAGVMGRLGAQSNSIAALLTLRATGGVMSTLIGILFIMVFVLWIKLVAQGFELLVLRMGVPLAALGLIDSDAALFKNYMQVFAKTGFTVVIQVSLMSLAFRLLIALSPLNILAAIAVMTSALSAPRLLQQFLVPQNGSGALQKASSAAMVARTVVMLVK